MSIKATGQGDSPEFTDFEGGFSWVAHPEEGMERASQALATDEGVWLVDPLEADGLEERIEEYGGVAGVVLLLDRHERDAPQLARRHDVPVTRPPDIERELNVPTERATDRLPGTDFEFLTVLDWPGWHEVGLWDGATLVVPESLGTNGFSRAGGERVGFNPVARVAPPRHLTEYAPEQLLVGHGLPVLEDPTPAMRDALANARRRLPQAWAGALRELL